MVAQYTAVFNQDIEKQTLQKQEEQQQQHQCPCASSNQDNGKKYSKLKLMTLGLVGLLFIGHSFGSSHSYHHHQFFSSSNEKDTPEIIASTTPSFSNNVLNSNGFISECSAENLHPWGGKSVYHISQTIQNFQFGETAKNTIINLKPGNINVVENKDLDETRVTLDIKLNDDTPDDLIRIEEEQTEDSYNLNINYERNEDNDKTCVQINALIEVPSSDALSSLILRFISDEINVKNSFEFKDQLELATVTGDITADEKIKATIIKLSNVGGGIQGVFDLNQGGEFTSGTVSGKVDVAFDHIASGSIIKSNTVNGQTDFQVPSDFESQFELTSTFGEVNVEATNTDILHYTRSDRMFEKSIKGSYGENENPTSKIIAKGVSGQINLRYE